MCSVVGGWNLCNLDPDVLTEEGVLLCYCVCRKALVQFCRAFVCLCRMCCKSWLAWIMGEQKAKGWGRVNLLGGLKGGAKCPE